VKPSSPGIFGSLAMAAPLTLFGLVVLAGATLKETPQFWRNAGGYPVELRELVLVGFYPACAIYFFWLLFGSLAAWRMLHVFKRAGLFLLLACALNWMLLAAITTVVLWNNVENVLQGQPLHQHTP